MIGLAFGYLRAYSPCPPCSVQRIHGCVGAGEVAVVVPVEDKAFEVLFGRAPAPRKPAQLGAKDSYFAGVGLGGALSFSVDHQGVDGVLTPVLRGFRPAA